eukprot:RCo000394
MERGIPHGKQTKKKNPIHEPREGETTLKPIPGDPRFKGDISVALSLSLEIPSSAEAAPLVVLAAKVNIPGAPDGPAVDLALEGTPEPPQPGPRGKASGYPGVVR